MDTPKIEPTSDTASFSYVHKKSERLAVAIHIITDHLGTDEKLMSLLRSTSLELLAEVSSLSTHTFRRRIGELSHVILRMKSYLLIGYQCGYISEQNFRLLEKEFGELDLFIASHSERMISPDIPQTFLSVPTERSQPRAKFSSRVATTVSPERKQNGVRHSERQKIILDLVAEKDKVSIKDVSSIITDCSEKTIQRELMAMVQKGILLKEGERRWSTYRLAEKPLV